MLPLKLFHPRVARAPHTSPLRVFVHALYLYTTATPARRIRLRVMSIPAYALRWHSLERHNVGRVGFKTISTSCKDLFMSPQIGASHNTWPLQRLQLLATNDSEIVVVVVFSVKLLAQVTLELVNRRLLGILGLRDLEGVGLRHVIHARCQPSR